jgi:hypothetical protein
LFADLAAFLECTSSPFFVPIDTPSYAPELVGEYIPEMWWAIGGYRETFYEVAGDRLKGVQ